MPLIPSNLYGEDGYERETNRHSGLETFTIPVTGVDEAISIMVEWGNTLPYSGYAGFFRVVTISKNEGLSYYTVTQFFPSLAEAANYIADLPEKLEALNPSIGGQVIAVQIVFVRGNKERLERVIRRKSGKFRKQGLKTEKQIKFEQERKRGKHPRDKNGRFRKRGKK